MNCRELIDFLADYLEEALPPEARERFEMHMSCCGPCADYLTTYRSTILLTRDAFCQGEADGPPAPPEDLIKAILAARRDDAQGCDSV